MATKKATNNTLRKRADQFKKTVKNINAEAINLSDNLVEASLSNTAKWQKLMGKALNEGTVLFGKQQEMVLDTLEEIKGQYETGNKRFKKLFNLEKISKRSFKPVEKVVKETKKVTAKVGKTIQPKASAKSDVKKVDLRQIEGIGPKIAELLTKADINTFEKLANTPVSELKVILEKAGPRFKSIDPTTWRMQAKRLLKK